MKETQDTRDVDSIPGLGRSAGGGNRNPLQHSCPGSPMDRGAWQSAVHGIAEWNATKRRSTCIHLSPFIICRVRTVLRRSAYSKQPLMALWFHHHQNKKLKDITDGRFNFYCSINTAIQSISLQFQFFFVTLKIWSLCEVLAIPLTRS